MYFINKLSGFIYTIVDEVQQPDRTIMVRLTRVGDQYACQVSGLSFAAKYREATAEETAVVNTRKAEMTSLGQRRTIYELTGTLPPARPRDPSLTEEGQRDLDQLQDPQRQNDSKVGIIYEPTEKDLFANMILHDDVVSSVKTGLNMIKKSSKIDEIFGVGKIEPVQGRCILNFYGPPGTGKTQTARCMARMLEKKLFQVDYSQMISKWVGDTAKHIKEAFVEAKKHDAILFWDEADAMLSKRLPMNDGGEANSVNQNRNVLMQELDRFGGIVIMTTNLFGNYDEAILRRIAQHVEFKLPDEEMRVKLIQLHFPIKDRIMVDYEQIAKVTHDFSGGDILNLCKNSMYTSANTSEDDKEWKITDEIMIKEAKKITESKDKHRKGGGGRGKISL